MGKQLWKAGNMLYPLPVVMVSVTDGQGRDNIITVAWTGTICSDPPMLSISVRPERFSYGMLRETGEFVVNLTTEKLARATDFSGVRSGREVDKFTHLGLTKEKGSQVAAPLIAESPVNIECRVTQREALGSHDLFLAKVLCVHADEAYMDASGRFDLAKAKPIVYDHGSYYGLGRVLGRFGYSVKKK
ncbi:MAG: flavin reductase family protein [Lachnospiraceae bacterium]|nr:flavin reductase family protein [Lachnospiraceae bacterium]